MRDNNKILEGGKEKYENSKFIMASYGTREMFGQWVTAAFGSSVFFFYEVRIGLDVGIAALALVLFSIWNSINDPFIGYIMERFHMPWEKKWGIRRFPWIIIGGIPWLFSFWFIFMVPLDWDPVDNQWQIFLWLLFSLCLYDIFFTIFDVNAISLYPEKFRGQKERRTAQGFGTILGIVGLVLSFIIFPSFLTEDPASYPRAASVTVVIGFFIFFMILPGVFENKKIRDEYSQRKNKIKDKKVESFLSSAKIVLKDRIFMVKVLFFFGYQAAVGLIQASALYMVIFILGDTEESFSFTILMAAMLVGALITVPIWLSISNKQKNNKKMGLIAGFVMFVSFLPMF
ncbi:MAG: MFS transporter, partial [archaeon]|nr:MFS transporter [archaeon]